MPQVYLRTRTFTFTPVARATTETKNLMAVKKGMRIVAVAQENKIATSTANTLSLRVSSAGGGASAGLQAAMDLSTTAVAAIVAGVGADLATSGGFLVTADGTLDAVYTAVGGGGSIDAIVRIGVTWSVDPVVAGLTLG